MKWYGYGILRPALDKVLARMTPIDKYFLLGIAIIFIAHTLLYTRYSPTAPLIGGYGRYVVPYEVTLTPLLNQADSLKALIGLSICYVLAKIGEITRKKKDEQHGYNY